MSMRRIVITTVVLAAALIALPSVLEAAPKKGDLATTGVTIYDCGLGQVEKQTKVTGAQELHIDVTLAHLDDLLASLVLATDDSVSVREVNYPSVRNLGQAVSSSALANALHTDGGAGITVPESVSGYLEALVGLKVRVERRGKKAAEGTVLACVDREAQDELGYVDTKGEGSTRAAVRTLVLVDDGGRISWIPVDDIADVAPVSVREAAALSNFATQLGKANGFTDLSVRLTTAPGSKGRLAAAYIRQMPLWKTAYKVTAKRDGVYLEVWAVVHNDTGEDWNDVEMTLVSGLPKSYVFSMASPRYVQRETIVLEGEGEMMPQLGAMTPDSLLYDFEGFAISESWGYGGIGLRGTGRGGGGGALGAVRGGTVGYGGVGTSERTSSLLEVGEPAAAETAEPKVEGEISTYRAMSKVTIPAGTSSMVPLVRRKLSGGAFTLLGDDGVASTCVRVENETGLVLQGGMASFYISGRFRGQTELRRTEPGEIGLWCFGEDPDVEFRTRTSISHHHELLEWSGDALWSHDRRRTTKTYEVENKAGQARSVAMEVRHIKNGRVISPKELKPTEDDGRWLHVTEVEGRAEVEKQLVVEEGIMKRIDLTPRDLDEMAKKETIPKKQREILSTARAFLVKRDQLASSREREVSAAQKKVAEAQETRDNLKALPQTESGSKPVERLLAKLLSAQKARANHEAMAESLERRMKAALESAKKILRQLTRPPAKGE